MLIVNYFFLELSLFFLPDEELLLSPPFDLSFDDNCLDISCAAVEIDASTLDTWFPGISILPETTCSPLPLIVAT